MSKTRKKASKQETTNACSKRTQSMSISLGLFNAITSVWKWPSQSYNVFRNSYRISIKFSLRFLLDSDFIRFECIIARQFLPIQKYQRSTGRILFICDIFVSRVSFIQWFRKFKNNFLQKNTEKLEEITKSNKQSD